MIGKKISQKMLKDIINLFIFNSFKETINWNLINLITSYMGERKNINWL